MPRIDVHRSARATATRTGYSSGITSEVRATSEVFPNAPLALVAVEVRFPSGPDSGPLRAPVFRALKDLLGPGWIIETGKHQVVEVAFESSRMPTPNVLSEDVSRLTVRDRTTVVTLRPESLTVEATNYLGWPAFRPLLQTVFSAVEKILAPDGLTRLGLRYIDEIRIAESVDWSSWVDPALLPPSNEDLVPSSWTGAAQYEFGPERRLVLRYGPADGPVVTPAGPLKRPRPAPSWPVFVLDFDSFWQPSDIPAFESAALLQACDDLRAPVRSLFDAMITDKLLAVYRREPTDE